MLLSLNKQAEESDFLVEGPALTVKSFVTDSMAGQHIDSYQIVRLLGEGAMGEIYLADQLEPIRRRVALKLIKPGLDSKAVLARFEAEKQALALMDHPNVATVIDAGVTLQGRPYFVMEYVSGLPITEHCDRHRLNIEERLELFTQVCDAVQHAHQKGVIHRDIKPSNILVASSDDRSVPKVIDFGVAKAIDQRLTEETLFTEQGQLIGTPAYMSPEQAELSAHDIDTRSDIYSLGVLLYELLAGTPPFDPQSFRQAAFDEVRHIIREVDPPKPSTKLSSMTVEQGERSTITARNRCIDPRTLTRRLRGDLGWITMKALEKERGRRNTTASDFAADIQRHLRNEPVIARPPSAIYRMKKFVRRNKGAVAASATIMIVLLASMVAITSLYIASDRAASEARATLAFVEDMLGSLDPYRTFGPETALRSMLSQATDRIEAGALPSDPRVRLSIRRVVGETSANLGLYELAERHLRAVETLLRSELGRDDPDALRARSRVGEVLWRHGKMEEAQALLEEVWGAQRQKVGPDHPDTLFSSNLLGNIHRRLGNLAQAEELHRSTLAGRRRALGDDHPDTL